MASIEIGDLGSFTLSPGWGVDMGAAYFQPGQWCRLAVSLDPGQPPNPQTIVSITGESVQMESNGTLLCSISVTNTGTGSASFTVPYIIVKP
jgi:hypothetical protein